MRRVQHIGILVTIWQLFVVINVSAAAITMADLPYLCDFEDDVENANWVLNPSVQTINTENRWVIGNAAAYTGEKSLYVSQDNGTSNTYAATNNVLLAYRDITLAAGDYDIAYDWIGIGNNTKGYLKIIYTNRPTSSLNCLGNATEPTWVATSVQLMNNASMLTGGDAWQHVQARITIPVAQANKTTTRLLFVWVNTDVTVKDSVTSVAIDNFQLAKASSTGYPENIHVFTMLNNATVTWEGYADEYEVMYRKKTDNAFTSMPATGTSVTLTDMDYGAYEFWICGKNGGDKTIYTIFPTVYLYETDCFDALNMYNATFEYGKWNFRNGRAPAGFTRIDYGPEDRRSRHTTHFDKTEVDPRTVIMRGKDTVACLKTIPNGEFGSVRLGNWLTGSEYESMTFTYEVESHSTAVLLIRYAMVLENPSHNGDEQPRFTLEVLNEAGQPIDVECASVDFHSPTAKELQDPEVAALWHTSTWAGSTEAVYWQDWKTIGISVDDYVGQKLTIILTSYDCDQGGHFGYAYFTLNCVRSDVDGLPWGEGSSTQMFTAPEGFDYAWFNRTDAARKDTVKNTDTNQFPYITDAGRYFYVLEGDTNTYLCHVTYPTNKECGYWFEASAKPHTPKAELKLQWTPDSCRNGYTWWNKCHVMLTNQITGEVEHRYDMQLDNCFLILEDGTEVPVSYVDEGTFVPMPDEGGTVRYGIWTGVYAKNQIFTDTVWYEFEIPAIGPVETHLYDSICRGEAVFFPAGSQNKYTETGIYPDSLSSYVTGCDSVILLHLHVHEPIEVETYDTICPTGSYSFAGRTLTTSGTYTGLFASLVTGCDSVVTLHLKQAPIPVVSLLSDHLCADEALTFMLTDGVYADSMYVLIEGGKDTVQWLRNDDIQLELPLGNHDVGKHTAIVKLYMPWCETVYTDTLTYGVNLANDIITMHWNDVLTFLSPEYNGGFTFSSYQWYCNGEQIDGATSSYYYNPNMDLFAEYMVKVTMSDGSEAWVCPFVPAMQGIHAPKAETTTAQKFIRKGNLVIQCNNHEYNAQGIKIK